VEKLCSHNSDLYAAEITLKFMLDELSSQKTVLMGNALKDSLIERIRKRRTNNSNMFCYLNNPKKEITGTLGLWHFQPEAKQNRNGRRNCKPDDSKTSRYRCRCE
jgi:hypothetical protein